MTGSGSKSQRRRGRLSSGRSKRHLDAAPRPPPSGIEPAFEGLSFAGILHDCLAPGVIVVDAKQRITSLNDHARKLLGLGPDQEHATSLVALPAAFHSMVRQTLAAGTPPADCQIKLKTTASSPVTIRLSAVPLHPGRKNSGVVLVLNDLTPARQIEQRIRQLDRLASVGTLAAGMAHEIKNALVAGRTFVDLLLEKHQDAELVDIVRREMSRIDTIVSRMRNFAGPSRPALREVRLHEILDHSLRLVRPQLEVKLVSVNRSLRASSDLLQGDDHQLQQAFVNLFLNALEAMGPNGTLSVATDLLPAGVVPEGLPEGSDNPQLRLTIEDNGLGIAPEHLARLFEPFFTTKPERHRPRPAHDPAHH